MTNSNTPLCCGIFSSQPEWAVCKATAENWKQAVLWELLWRKHKAAGKRDKKFPLHLLLPTAGPKGTVQSWWTLRYHDKAVQCSQQTSNPNWPSKKPPNWQLVAKMVLCQICCSPLRGCSCRRLEKGQANTGAILKQMDNMHSQRKAKFQPA